MKHFVSSLLFTSLVLSTTLGTIGGDVNTRFSPRFVIVLWAQQKAQIIAQGDVSQSTFRRLFLDRYVLGGERLHPPEGSAVVGVVIARDETSVVTVPIRTWRTENGVTVLLCQASDDGSPPAFSTSSNSEKDLLRQIEQLLNSKTE